MEKEVFADATVVAKAPAAHESAESRKNELEVITVGVSYNFGFIILDITAIAATAAGVYVGTKVIANIIKRIF